MIIIPVSNDFMQWATAVAYQLGLRGTTVAVDGGAPWQDWAKSILRLPQINSQSAPRVDDFGDWEEWAVAFNRSVEY
jgi:hypothetical protein